MKRLAAIAVLAGMLATPALAALDDVPLATDDYRGVCVMDQTCNANGNCGAIPVLGQLLVTIDADGTQMGRDGDDLAPIDRYGSLEEALPLQPTEEARRTFLVDLPFVGVTRRFSVRVQVQGRDGSGPFVRPQSFILTCEAAPT